MFLICDLIFFVENLMKIVCEAILVFLLKIWCKLRKKSYLKNWNWKIGKEVISKNMAYNKSLLIKQLLQKRWSQKKRSFHAIVLGKPGGREGGYPKKGLLLTSTPVIGCFCWKFAQKALFWYFRMFFSKNPMFLTRSRWKHWWLVRIVNGLTSSDRNPVQTRKYKPESEKLFEV